ncbi:MAG: response regulator transcription factor [Chloroflexota bacterium]|nr:response regulator transcription factor [Chloroflexota bacterium]
MALILIVDDDAHLLRVMKRGLGQRGHSILTASDGDKAIGVLQERQVDLVILDIVLPHVDGIQVCRYIRRRPELASIPLLFLTAREKIEDKVAGFEAGADDYLTKPFDMRELELRTEALLRTAPRNSLSGVLAKGCISADPDTQRVYIEGQEFELTPVEFELFFYLLANAEQPQSAEHLLQAVWGYPPGMGNTSLVRMHVFNIRRKIEEDASNPKYLCTVTRHGYAVFPFS